MRIEFNAAGFRELLTSAAAEQLLRSHAERIAATANAVPSTTEPAAIEDYYEIEDGSDNNRARLRIRAASRRAVRHEAKTQALLRVLLGG